MGWWGGKGVLEVAAHDRVGRMSSVVGVPCCGLKISLLSSWQGSLVQIGPCSSRVELRKGDLEREKCEAVGMKPPYQLYLSKQRNKTEGMKGESISSELGEVRETHGSCRDCTQPRKREWRRRRDGYTADSVCAKKKVP